MPTTRRKQAAAASQSKLSFNNKSARVTKPSVTDPNAKKAAPPSKLSEAVATAEITPDDELPKPEKVEDEANQEDEQEAEEEQEKGKEEIQVPIRSSPSKPKKKVSTQSIPTTTEKETRELAAQKITDAQIKKYWTLEEQSRLAPRVHQSQVPLHEKILRHFDLSSQYGPCIGIQRLARWKRANSLDLEPPVEVLAVLLREEDQKKSQGSGKLAYIDELAGGRVVLVE